MVIPVSSWKAMKDSSSGVVRTPPKSEIDGLDPGVPSAIGADDLVVAEAVAALQRPAEEGDLRASPGRTHRAGADQAAGAAQRRAALAVGPELERRPALDAVGPVLGGEQRLGELDRGAVGAAEDRGHLLVAVVLGAGRGASRVSAKRPPSEKTIPIERRRARRRPARDDIRRAARRLYALTRDMRSANPRRDAAACAAIYAPHVEDGATSFEERAPDAEEIGCPDRVLRAAHAWLVAEEGGEVVGFAYATGTARGPPTAGRSTSRSTSPRAIRGRGTAAHLYEALLERPSRARLPRRLRGHHPAQRGQRRASRGPRLRAGRRLPRIGWKAGAWRDVGWWQLRLRRGGGPAGRAACRPASPLPLSHVRRTHDRHAETLSEDDVLEALEEVIDPELGLDFVSLGLVYDVEVEKEDVYVTFTLTTPACPIGPQVSEQMKEFVGDLPGVSAVHPKMIFDPAWSPEMMTEDAKFALGF